MIDGAIVVDGHVDTPLRLLDEDVDLAARLLDGHVDLPRLREGGVDAVFLAAWVDPTIAEGSRLGRARALLAAVRQAAERQAGQVELATTAAEVRRAAAAGKVAWLLGVENADALEGRVEAWAPLHALGARYLTLTWMSSNAFADSATGDARHGGLSDAGRELVDELNRSGTLIDLAHASPATFDQVLERSAAPAVVSHAAAAALDPSPRNVDDGRLRALGERGGLFGVAFFAGSMAAGPGETFTWTGIVDHLEHVAEVAGLDAVALGSDLDGFPVLPSGVEGIQDVRRIAAELERRGWGPEERAKALGGNWLRVLERVVDRNRAGDA